tara:strand:- start:145 stop:660 length:516 start_codon:yes stop_codon:yes gene_type:complete
MSDIEDFIDFSLDEIESQYGSEALNSVVDEIRQNLDDLRSAIEFSESDEEREFAQEQLDDFTFTQSEAVSIAEDFEFEFLSDYMSQSYKFDQDLIDRYVELVGGSTTRSTPAPSPAPSPPPSVLEEEDLVDDDFFEDDFFDDEEDFFEENFFDLDLLDLADIIGNFFDEFF